MAKIIKKGQILNNPIKKLEIALNPEVIAFQIYEP